MPLGRILDKVMGFRGRVTINLARYIFVPAALTSMFLVCPPNTNAEKEELLKSAMSEVMKTLGR